MKKKTLAASIMTIAMCGSLVTGATFALFTHESETNVAISTGKVEVVASLENLALYSPTLISADGSEILNADNAAANNMFANGGTATLVSPELTLSNMTPGDYATFQIKVTNYSTVTAQYRTILKVVDDNGLADGLEMGLKAGSEEDYTTYEGDVVYSNWATLSIPAGEAEVVELNDCKIELPIDAGNQYEEKSCKFVCVVEAIQANADTSNQVAKIGDASYDSLAEAVSELKEGDTLEITRPGTYAPFTISQSNVTVKGIVGATKAESTVIKNTATERLTIVGTEDAIENVTIDSLWIDSTTSQTSNGNGVYGVYGLCAISTNPNFEKGWLNATSVTVNGCHIEGDGKMRVTNYMGANFTFTNNTVQNFNGINYYESSAGINHTYTGNVISGITGEAVIYCAYNNANMQLTFNNNTFRDQAATMLTITDAGSTAFAGVEMKGNTGNVIYRLNLFNNGTATPHTVEAGDGKVVYCTSVAVDANGNDLSLYVLETADGGAYCGDQYGAIALGNSVWVSNGTYNLVEKETGNVVSHFTVNIPEEGVTQTIKLPAVVSVGTAEDLKALFDNAFTNLNAESVFIQLNSDIDANNNWSSFAIPNMSADITIDGAGHTISNLNAPLVTGLWGGSCALIYENLTIANSTLTDYDTANVGGSMSAAGAFLGYVDNGESVEFKNCHLMNTQVVGSADYAGGFAGYASVPVQFTDCSVTECTISGYKSVGTLIGHQGGGDLTVTNCTITGNVLGETRNVTTGIGIVFGRTSGGDTVTMKSVTQSGNTLWQNYGAAEPVEITTEQLYGSLNGYTVVIE